MKNRCLFHSVLCRNAVLFMPSTLIVMIMQMLSKLLSMTYKILTHLVFLKST